MHTYSLQIINAESCEDQVISDLQTKVDVLETKFQSLTAETLERLQHDGVSMDTFYARVTNMMLTLKQTAGKYLRECFKQLGPTSTLEVLWGDLNFWGISLTMSFFGM